MRAHQWSTKILIKNKIEEKTKTTVTSNNQCLIHGLEDFFEYLNKVIENASVPTSSQLIVKK
jgi:hypothetical protein